MPYKSCEKPTRCKKTKKLLNNIHGRCIIMQMLITNMYLPLDKTLNLVYID